MNAAKDSINVDSTSTAKLFEAKYVSNPATNSFEHTQGDHIDFSDVKQLLARCQSRQKWFLMLHADPKHEFWSQT